MIEAWHVVCRLHGMYPRWNWAVGSRWAGRLGIAGALALAGGVALAQPDPTAAMPGSRTCAKECHREIFDHKVMHGPALSDCQACHVQGNPDDHKFYLISKREELCVRCHNLVHTGPLHQPVKEGLCLECHDPHGSDHPRMMVADPQRDLCTRCHQKDFASASFVHGPVAVGSCIVCHKPHSSAVPGLLTQDARTLCLTCHAEIGENASAAGMHKHGALEEGCTRCHDPHASNHRFQLREQAPGLCLSCHREKFEQMVGGAKVVHGAVTAEGGCTGCHEPHASRLPALQKGTEPGVCLHCHDKILHTEDGATLANMKTLLAQNPQHHGPIREGVCTACHSPHAAEHFRLLVEDYPPQFYAPFQIDTFKLCFKCHIPDLVLKPSGQGLTQFRDGDRNLHYLHVNQVKGRTCRACHEVHASRRPAHVREAVPFGSEGWMLEINFQATAQGGSCAPGCHQPKKYDRGPSLAGSAAGLVPMGEKP